MIYTLTLNPALDKQYSVEHLTFDSVLKAQSIQLDYGGKGFNVSRMLAHLGMTSTALGFVGGVTGSAFAPGLAEQGILSDLTTVAQETRTNTTVVSKADKRHIKVNEPGPTIQAKELEALTATIQKHLVSGDVWVLAGSLPPGVSAEIYAELTNKIKAAGSRVVLDASGPALQKGLTAGPVLAKPNLLELSELTGKHFETLEDAARHLSDLRELGAENLAVSGGKHGALITDGSNAWVCAPPSSHEVNPVGAGDAMVAGLVRSFVLGHDLPTALRWGVACGTAAARTSGTQMPALAQVEAVYAELKVMEI